MGPTWRDEEGSPELLVPRHVSDLPRHIDQPPSHWGHSTEVQDPVGTQRECVRERYRERDRVILREVGRERPI